MANIFVKVTTSVRLGAELQRLADLMAATNSHLAQVRNVMDNMTDGVNYTTLETNFGLPTGVGAAAHTVIKDAHTAYSTNPSIQLVINALGGITS